MKFFYTFFILLITNSLSAQTIKANKHELQQAGHAIFKNETSGNRLLLVHWNIGEDFPSLGIGHFIWYPEDYNGPFTESFPSLVHFYQQHGYHIDNLPTIMQSRYPPWQSRQELLDIRHADPAIQELITFLMATMDIQVAYILQRLEASLPTMMDASNHPKKVKKEFYRVAKSTGGLYSLIDYVNFKGEGIHPTERYNGQGWGLLQVLEGMKGGKAIEAFSHSATMVLDQRINNAPPERGEERWREGWMRRVKSYK